MKAIWVYVRYKWPLCSIRNFKWIFLYIFRSKCIVLRYETYLEYGESIIWYNGGNSYLVCPKFNVAKLRRSRSFREFICSFNFTFYLNELKPGIRRLKFNLFNAQQWSAGTHLYIKIHSLTQWRGRNLSDSLDIPSIDYISFIYSTNPAWFYSFVAS